MTSMNRSTTRLLGWAALAGLGLCNGAAGIQETTAETSAPESALADKGQPTDAERRANLDEQLIQAQASVRPLLLYDERGTLQRQVGAFRIQQDGVVTSAAVLRGIVRAAWELEPGRSIPVRGVTALDRERGIVLLALDVDETETGLPPILEPRPRVLRTGPLLGAVGISLTMQPLKHVGRLAEVIQLPGLGRMGRAADMQIPGLEGGPVFAEDGALVGVLGEVLDRGLRCIVPMRCLLEARTFERPVPLTQALPQLDPRVEEGRLLMLGGEADRAIALLADVNGPEADFWRGLALSASGQGGAAADALKDSIETNRNLATSLAYGAQLLELDQPSLALSVLRETQELAPDSPAPRFAMALLFRAIGRDNQALQSLRQALNRDPVHVEAMALRGDILVSRKRLSEAQPYLEDALAIDPNSADALAGMGRLLLAKGEPTKALACFRRALATDPDLAQGHLLMARTLLALEQGEEGLAFAERAIELDPQSPETYLAYGDLLVSLNRHEEALEPFESATILDPTGIEGHLAMGQTLKHLRRFQDALTPLNRALGIEGRHPTALFNVGFCYLQTGERGKARDAYKVLQHIDGRAARILYALIYDK